jgi:hypothetical protein
MRRRLPLIGYIVLAFAVLLALISQQNQISENAKTRAALCAHRNQLDQQIVVTEMFLRPRTAEQRRDARKIFAAIPRQLVANGQRRNRQERSTLSVLDC